MFHIPASRFQGLIRYAVYNLIRASAASIQGHRPGIDRVHTVWCAGVRVCDDQATQDPSSKYRYLPRYCVQTTRLPAWAGTTHFLVWT